jgi:diguanylate cyclase (GGDEF)-like protein
MLLDTRTMVFALASGNLIMAIGLYVVNRTAHIRAITLWVTASVALFIAWTIFGLRGWIPVWSSVGFGFAALNIGYALEYSALAEFSGRTIRGPVLVGFVAAGIALNSLFYSMHPEDERSRVVLEFTIAALWLFACGFVTVVRLSPQERTSHLITAGFFFGNAIGDAVRVAQEVMNDSTSGSMMAVSPEHTLSAAVNYVAMFGTSLGFLLMSKERADYALLRMASLDTLTGLLNRRSFIDGADRELSRAQRQRLHTSMLMLDLDLFKAVNDTFGHIAGDLVLANFAHVLRYSVRPFDIAGRYGGEEFCVILPGTGLEEALGIAERIRGLVAQSPVNVHGTPIVTTVSIGVAEARFAAGTFAELIERADRALYAAKAAGRNCVRA